LPLSLRFTRLDNGEQVDAAADLSMPPPSPALEALLQRCASSKPDPQALVELGPLWQQRVQHLLLDLAWDNGVFVVRRIKRRLAPTSRILAC